jgi:hypothetical protein
MCVYIYIYDGVIDSNQLELSVTPRVMKTLIRVINK